MRLAAVGTVALVAGATGGTPTVSRSVPPQSAPPLELTYLANMGVLLEVGNRRVIVDGLHRAELDGTPPIPPDLLGPLESATGRMRPIEIAMTTHRHLDHFSASSVAARLRADPIIHYLAPTEVIDTLRARGLAPSFLNRVHALGPPTAGRTELELTGIRVTALDLPHNRTRTPRAQNVGYLIRLDGITILHVGDADPSAERYAPHNLPAERIDVAIVPTWYLTDGADLVRQQIAPRMVVASHIWLDDTARVRREVRRHWPAATVLIRPGERIRIPR
jgi:L-ascorbate metabolism protein UlaG (beta-lactamase superfamily)